MSSAQTIVFKRDNDRALTAYDITPNLPGQPLLPISVLYGRIGNPDHHCAVALVGTTLLLIATKLASPRERMRGLATLFRIRSLRAYWMARQAAGLGL